MAGRISESVIQQILDRVNLSDLIGQQVKLRRAGRNFVGLCPFHTDSKPSFSVSTEKGFYYCFGCHEGGTALTFMMKTRGLSYHEAIEQLAASAGIKVEYEEGDGAAYRQIREKRQALLAVNAEANAFFRTALASPVGKNAQDYLAQRGIDPATASRFMIGFAPGGSALYKHFSAKGTPLNLAMDTGLLVRSQRTGDTVDRYHARVTFPVLTTSDEVAGFSARALPGGQDPKYLNSPDSEVFKKGELVFGLAQAREAIKKEGYAILVEGQVDVISMHQAGFHNAVAPLGTALTEHQAALIRRFTDNVYVMFDGDDAGIKATWRTMPILMTASLKGKVVALPRPEDPDSLLRKQGPDAIRKSVAEARPFLEHAIAALTEKGTGNLHYNTGAAARGGMEFASQIPDPTDRQVFLQRLAAVLGVPLSALKVAAVRPQAPAGQGASSAPAAPPSPHEQEMARWVAMRPELARTACQEDVFDLVRSDPVRRLLAAVLDAFEEHGKVDINGIVASLEDPGLRDICAAALMDGRTVEPSVAEKGLAGLVRIMKADRLKEREEQLRLEIRKAQAGGDEARTFELVAEQDAIVRQLRALGVQPRPRMSEVKEVV